MSVPVTWSTLHGWYHTIDRYSASIFFILSVLFSQMVWALCLYTKLSIPVQEKQQFLAVSRRTGVSYSVTGRAQHPTSRRGDITQ